MKFLPSFIILLLQCLCSLAIAADIHVAPDGNDTTNTGSAALPYATIGKASSVAGPGDQVILHAGLYREKIRPSASGTLSDPIVYKAYRSGNAVDTVTISSFDVIIPGAGGTGTWQAHAGSVYKIQLSPGLVLPLGQNMIEVDGDPLREARWPNAPRVVDFRRAHMARADDGDIDLGSSGGTGTYTGWYDDADLTAFAPGVWTGGYIQLVAEQGWWQKSGTITDFSGQRVTFRWAVTNTNRETPSKMDPYYLAGRLAALDEAGEFFLDVNGLDGPANMLYLWLPDNADPNTRTVGIKTRREAGDLTNRSYIELQDLTFIGGRLWANSASVDTVIERCTVLYGAYDAYLYDPWDGGGRPAISLANTGHRLLDSNVFHTMAHGISLSDNIEIDNCVVFNAWIHGISTDNTSNLTITDNTVFDTGTTLISISGSASQFLRNHIFKGGQHITDIELMNTYNSGDALGTEVAWNWMHDNRAEDEPLYRWNGGGGIRLDSGGSSDGCSNYLIHHNVIWNAGSRGISIWGLDPGMINYGAVDGAKIYVYNNTTDSNVGIRAGLDATGIHLINNLALNDLYFGNTSLAADATLANNRKATPSDFTDATGKRFSIAAGSPAIDAGAVIPGITDGYQGAAPDIGAYEEGLPELVPGARILEEDLLDLVYTHRILNDGSSIIEVSGLPLGRTVPDGMTLRIAGSLVLSSFYRTWDFENGRFGACFPFDYTSIGFMEIGLEHSLDGSSYAPANQGTLLIKAPGTEITTIQKLSIGDSLSLSGTSLHGYDHNRIPLVFPHLIGDDLYLRPLPLRFDSASLIASGVLQSDGSDLWFPVGDTGSRLQFTIESGWNTPDTLAWLRFPPNTHTFREEKGLTLYLAGGGINTPPGDQIDLEEMFPYIDFSQIALWLRPDSIIDPLVEGDPITQWSDLSGLNRHATQADTARQPLIRLSVNRPPAVEFDGSNDYLRIGDLPFGNYDSWTIYRTPAPGSTPHQRTYSATPRSHPNPSQELDYLGGLADIPEREPDGTPVIYTDLTMARLSRTGKYPDDLIIGGQSANAAHPAFNMFQGEITEILIFSDILHSSVQERIEEAYLAMKYGLAISNGYYASLDTGAMLTPLSISLNGTPVDTFSLSTPDTLQLTIPDLGPTATTLSLAMALPDGSILSFADPVYYWSLPYDGWRIDKFIHLANGPMGAGTERTDDADQDDRSNFAEFAFDDDPLSGTTGPNWPQLVKIADQLYLQMTTGRPSAEVNYTLRFSHDLIDWSDPSPIDLPVDTQAGELIQVPLSPTPGTPLFTGVETTEL